MKMSMSSRLDFQTLHRIAILSKKIDEFSKFLEFIKKNRLVLSKLELPPELAFFYVHPGANWTEEQLYVGWFD